MKKQFLFTPGPTPIPPAVLQKLAEEAPYHRSELFRNLIQRIQPKLQNLFDTDQPVLLLACSGTGALEASMVSLLKRDKPILILNAGKFGERIVKMAKAFSIPFDEVKKEWGAAFSVEDVSKHLKPEHQAICFQASETSTGTAHDFAGICDFVKTKQPKTITWVDGITAVGAVPISIKKNHIDVLCAASQKALMLPPGLSLVGLSTYAVSQLDSGDLPRFYFDLKREYDAILKQQTAWTPANQLIAALEVSLEMLETEGLAKVYQRHQLLAKATREGLTRLSLRLASTSPSVAASAAFLPDGLDGKAFLKNIRNRYGYTIAGGQDAWEGRVIRVSHLGFYHAHDLMKAIAAIGEELKATPSQIAHALEPLLAIAAEAT